MDALRQTMLVQAEVVQNVEADSGELARLVAESQAAIGSLQAQQATNQLVALSTKQQLQTQELVAAQYTIALRQQSARTSLRNRGWKRELLRALGTALLDGLLAAVTLAVGGRIAYLCYLPGLPFVTYTHALHD